MFGYDFEGVDIADMCCVFVFAHVDGGQAPMSGIVDPHQREETFYLRFQITSLSTTFPRLCTALGILRNGPPLQEK